MTSTIIAVSVVVEAEHVDRAELAIGELSPGGFEQDPLAGGDMRFTIYLPEGDEHRVATWLNDASIELLEAPRMETVPSDWSERWKEFHQPVIIGGLWVGPPWQVDSAPSSMRRVVIEPAQGFGTGAHPTTHLMLALLQDQPRGSLLDLGCGSGVLSVAASMLGFSPVIATDNDPVAVESTRDNLERNGIKNVEARCSDALVDPMPKVDVVLANVLLAPLLQIAPTMTAPRVLLSGLLRSQADECAAAYESVGYVLRERRDREGWSALVLDDARPAW